MIRIVFLTIALLLTGCATPNAPEQQVVTPATTDDQARAVSAILRLAAERTLSGPASAPALQWPESLAPVMTTLGEEGYQRQVNALRQKMAQGMDAALARSGPVIQSVIEALPVDNASSILAGPEDAATAYLRMRRGRQLVAGWRPVMREALEDNGFFRQYRGLMDIHDTLPLKDKPAVDIEAVLLEQGMATLFRRLASAEAAIRSAPAERGNALIKAALNR